MRIAYDRYTGTKFLRSEDYNYNFNTSTGEFVRWGKTLEDDPKVGMLEIFDLEVSTVCNGIPSPGESIATPCGHCYKSNTKRGSNMSFETFKHIFDLLPKSLTQIAFGIGDIDANADLVRMFDYCRDNDHNPHVVPNITINGYGLSDEWANTLAAKCGGVAVSRYENKDVCYDAVKKLTDAGIVQCNIHQVLAEQSLDQCYELIDDVVSDPRLSKVKAIVFLTLKPKGKRNTWTTVKDVAKYRDLINYAFDRNVGIGFDSCSAPTFLASMKEHPNFAQFESLSESCESDRFSGYADVNGNWWHCSFTADMPGWKSVNLLTVKDFDKEVWHSPAVEDFRKCLTCQSNDHVGREVYLCPVYSLYDNGIGDKSRKVIIMEKQNEN